MIKKGFSLTEVLLSIGLISFMSISLYVVNIQYLHRNEMQDALTTLSSALNFAQSSSVVMRQDSNWSIHASGNDITVYKGSIYAARDTQHDDLFTVSEGINISIPMDIVYQKYTGDLPSSRVATITARNNETKTVQINTQGVISY